jgi:hypothetical protein
VWLIGEMQKDGLAGWSIRGHLAPLSSVMAYAVRKGGPANRLLLRALVTPERLARVADDQALVTGHLHHLPERARWPDARRS